ncbi:hypothetical protein [Streptomyces flaveolus]|uniref:hypothetical protein n=1 Tax=Streptomyces flaveolus TaxID=67297 RepID=UPI0033C22E97
MSTPLRIGVADDLRVGPARLFVVPPHGQAGVCFHVRVRVTGPVRGTLSGCRFRSSGKRDERYGGTPLDGVPYSPVR